MRAVAVAAALLVSLSGCPAPSEAPSIVAITPADGSTFDSKCPIQVQFSRTIHNPTLKTGGTLQPQGAVGVLWRDTATQADTAEFYPPTGAWNPGAGTFEFSLSELFGAELSQRVSYTVRESEDERWARPAAHQNGHFLQGVVTDVWFADANTGFAVGTNGMVIKTTNGGTTWAHVDGDRTQRWMAVWGSDAQNVWTLGGQGMIRRSSDGGETWSVLTTIPTLVTVYGQVDLQGFGDVLLLAGRNVVLRSVDGGVTWAPVANVNDLFMNLYLQDANNFWAITANGLLLHSVDQGVTWTQTELDLPASVHAITGDGAGALWVSGAQQLLAQSVDLGATWTLRHHERLSTEPLVDLWTSDGQHVWAAGSRGSLLTTDDGGATWDLQEERFPTGITALHAVSATNLWVSGPHGLLAETENGRDWQARTTGSSDTFSAVWVKDASTLTAVGAKGVVLTSADDGASWVRRDPGTTEDLIDLWGTGAERWVTDATGAVHHSDDDGATWSRRSAVETKITAITGADAEHLWMAGGDCALFAGEPIYRSTDGGTSWQAVEVDALFCITDLWASDASHVWAAGRADSGGPLPDAAVFRSSDGGLTWQRSNVGSGTITAIHGSDGNHLWAVGEAEVGPVSSQALVARSSDGGETWTREFWGYGAIYRDVWTADGALAWGVGATPLLAPQVFSTANSCQRPAPQPAVGHEEYNALHGTSDGRRVWLVGPDGLIAKLDRG